MKNKSPFNSVKRSLELLTAVERSKDAQGRPDAFKASGIAYGLQGDLSNADMLELGAYLAAEGAFDSAHNFLDEDGSDLSWSHSEQCHASARLQNVSAAEARLCAAKAKVEVTRQEYWEELWRLFAIVNELPPLEASRRMWMRIEHDRMYDGFKTEREYEERFSAWLREKHGIQMDENHDVNLI